jgi:malonyl-CoA O-methyltransferase
MTVPPAKRQIRAAFARRAALYAQHDAAQRQIARRLAALLPSLTEIPTQPILDAGCGVGRDFSLLAHHFSGRLIIGVDAALPLLTTARQHHGNALWVAGDLEVLPLPDASTSLYWSNCAWQWTRPEPTVNEAYRVLAPGGELVASIIVAGTFPELAQAAAVLGESAPLAPLPSDQQWQQTLVQYPWQRLAVTTTRLTCYFADAASLLASIRGVGATATGAPPRFDRTRQKRLTAALTACTTPAGVPLTYALLLVVARK